MLFTIFTDSSANLTKETLAALDIRVVSLTYSVNGEERLCYDPDVSFDGDAYYNALRDPAYHVRTSLINADRFKAAFEPELSAGNDIAYLAMSSGISGTYQSAVTAAEELKAIYPKRRIFVIDTKAASLGEGLMVCRAAMMREDGKTIEEIAAWVEQARESVRQYFLVDDLQYLSRGGRIGGVSAFVGTMLQIKPIMKGEDGKIVVDSKVPGRKLALRSLADFFEKLAIDPASQTVGIAHGGCEKDALALRDMIFAKHPSTDFMIVCYEPGTGAHVGPGTVALFFYGRNEKPDSLSSALLKRLDLDSGRLRAFVADKLQLLKRNKGER